MGMANVLKTKQLNKDTGVQYNSCPYGKYGLCMKDERSQCLLKKCYHDMDRSEGTEFQHFWLAWQKGRRWLRGNRYIGVVRNGSK